MSWSFFFKKPDVNKLYAQTNVPGLIKALRYKEPQVRLEAADRLGKVGGKIGPVIAALMQTLKQDPHPGPRKYAAISLGRLRVQEAAGELLRAAEDQDEDAGWGACIGLMHLYERRAIPFLVSRLKVRSSGSDSILQFMAEMRDLRVVEPLIQLLPEPAAPFVADIVKVLDRIDPNWRSSAVALEAGSRCVDALSDSNTYEQRRAKEALKELRDSAEKP
jgi:HEAT repeat protein